MKADEHDNSVKGVSDTHVDSANPLCFFMGTECSPFSANGRLFAGELFVRARSADCGAKEGQSDGKEPKDEHSSGWGAGGCSSAATRKTPTPSFYPP